MGQILGSDIIAVPSHSSGTITLPPSLLTLGGRQYRTSTLSRLISADVTMTANTLYFVYAQIVSGVPALRISASVPSVYVLSNPTEKLVGAFYSNGAVSVAFGSFVNIYGPPRSESIPYVPATTQGFGSVGSLTCHWSRNGDMLYHRSTFVTGTVVGSEARLGIPFQSAGSSFYSTLQLVGDAIKNQQTGSQFRLFTFIEPSVSYLTFGTGTSGSSGFLKDTGTNIIPTGVSMSVNAHVAIASWSNTQLADL